MATWIAWIGDADDVDAPSRFVFSSKLPRLD
jgi:hypothetical protein